MNDIIFKHIFKSYGDTKVVKDFNLKVNEGERLILLGPSGCGKTTTLRMIAGLEEITGGEIEMGGRVVNNMPPGERNIAMVFQNYALFPHLSVWDNVIFGLKLQKLPLEEIKKRANEALTMLHLEEYAQRKPKELSGGQKQRVALCRALVKQSPYFLLDEPLSNLDAKLRQQARTELVNIHRLRRPTMVYVTHDQVEAMTVGHRIAVMKMGELQQVGKPDEVYHHPANTFVAGFIGTPPMNLIPGTIVDGKLFLGKEPLEIPASYKEQLAGRTQITFGVRPERCSISNDPMVASKTVFVENLGNQRVLHMDVNEQKRLYVCTNNLKADPETIKGFNFDWEDVCLFDVESGTNLAL